MFAVEFSLHPEATKACGAARNSGLGAIAAGHGRNLAMTSLLTLFLRILPAEHHVCRSFLR